MTALHLASLHRYPIKSCAGESLPAAEIDAFGVHGDRRWMVVDPDGRFLTQRELPVMARIRPTPTSAGLRLAADDRPGLDVPFPAAQAERIEVQVWRSRVTAPLADQTAHAWLSAAIGRDCRLVYMADDVLRPINPEFSRPGDRVSFADGYPLLLATTATLAALNERLPAPVPMDRFRPSVVVAGAEPFAEETWRRVVIGGVPFDVVKPCERCVIITIDQATGVLQGPEPLRTLAAMRPKPGGVIFGMNLIQRSRGTLRVGDAVEVVTA